jgi:hypothetical protein
MRSWCVTERDTGRVIFKALAVVPHDDREQAVAGLCDQLRVMTAAAGAVPIWDSLAVEGPTPDPVHLLGPGWFRWVATVAVHPAAPVEAAAAEPIAHG